MKTRSVFLSLLFVLAGPLAAQPVSPVRLSALATEHQQNPIGIGDTAPRFSWKLLSDRQGEAQTAYEIRAASTAALLKAGQGDLWSSGKVASDQSVLVPWGGSALGSRSQVFWQVRVWDKNGQPSAWSDPASFELGLLNPATDWKGQWITVDLPRFDIEEAPLAKANWINASSAANQATGIRLNLDLPAGVKVLDAYLDVSADGLIALYVNGLPTRQGSTSHTAPFHADFGPQLNAGHNLIAILSGAVRNNRGGGGRNAIAAHGVVDLDNGKRIEFVSDGSWKAGIVPNPGATGPSATAIPAPDSWPTLTFDDSAWTAATVVGPYTESKPVASADSTIGPGRYLRKTFTVKGPVAKARLYSTAFGVYEASINGQRVNDHQLDPGFTDYNIRVMVQDTDVAALLKPGPNVVGALLGDGWFAGRLGWDGLYQYKPVSDHPLFNAQLEITYADGTKDTIATDNTWKGGSGEMVGSDDQLGEVIDARKTLPWNQTTFDDSGWTNATVEDHSATALVPQVGPPVRTVMELAPKKITKLGNDWIVDFGQNMVGHVRLTARGPANTVINVTHAEMLNTDGSSLYTENLRSAISLDTFTLKGGGALETFEPHFTFHGFRYAEISGYPGELTADNIRGEVVGSDNPATGAWESSNADLNQLMSNIQWGQRGNYLSIPTDCPQRDERMGWMGDAQVFAPTAALNSDVAGFFAKWTIDIDDDQTPQGAYSTVNPKGTQRQSYPVWGDAGVIIPWLMYTTYGDTKFLADHFDAMARWVDYCTANPQSMNAGVGDHLAPVATPTAIVDNAYYANSADILAKSAAILGKTDAAAKYSQLHDSIVAAYQTNYIGPDGSITAAGGGRGFGRGGAPGGTTGGRGFGGGAPGGASGGRGRGGAFAGGAPGGASGGAGAAPGAGSAAPAGTAPGAGRGAGAGARSGNTQASYVFALRFNLAPENLRPAIAQRLADDVTQKGHLTTGFPGTGFLCPMLTQIGRSDLAWQLVFTDTYPSWLFEVKNGATTMWERWDGWTPDNGFQASSMNSFNHYSFGAVGFWFYTGAAGIQKDESSPGYKHFIFAPQFTSRLNYIKSSFDSPYGKISSYWHVEGDQMVYDVTVPPNSSATLSLPFPTQSVKQAGQPLAAADAPTTSLPLAAGSYQFSFPRALIK
jgi:alpha-L-rhamnosidase